MLVILNLLVFGVLCGLLYWLGGRLPGLSQRIFAGLAAGIVYGLGLQLVYGGSASVVQDTLEWTNVLGTTYVNLLRMIVMPLVLVMMIAAVVRMREVAALGRIGGTVIGILVVTTMIAALIGIFVAQLFALNADAIIQGARELERAEELEQRFAGVADLGLADMLVRFVPQNLFEDLAGARDTSIIAVVIFGMLFGLATLAVMRDQPQRTEAIVESTETMRLIIMQLVKLVMLLTPWGIFALITKVVAGSNGQDILNLLAFVVASYVAIALMFVVHALLLGGFGGIAPRAYFQRVWPVLTFAFTSRSSAATIPLTVAAQQQQLNVPAPIAHLAATFGATIGQNGCAGIYPAMLAVMIAPSMGIDPLAPLFIAQLVFVVAIGSFGIAGVGGGATFAAFVVLPALGFPVTVAAVLISIEPLIDMARTALNVNGAMTAGVLTSRWVPMAMSASEPTTYVSETR